LSHRALTVLLAIFLAWAWCPSAQAGLGMGSIEERPEITKAKMQEKAEADYKEGMTALAKGDTARAVQVLRRVYGAHVESEYPKKAAAELQKLEEQCGQEFVVARQLVAGEDPEAGVLELARISRTYAGLPSAKFAGAFLLQLKQDPKFQQALIAGKAADDLAKAKDLERQAEAIAKGEDPAGPAPEDEAIDPSKPPPAKPAKDPPKAAPAKPMTAAERQAAHDERLAQAYQIYTRVASTCPDTKPGKEAAAAVERLEKNSDFLARKKQADAEKEAKQWLGLAEAYYKNGRFDLAYEFARKVRDNHPDVPQAAQAKALIEKMKK
jgi:outer membrane protein assembly factor BamD (BamD/ComL family)